jgi:uncharacterized phage protein gp47/JayE
MAEPITVPITTDPDTLADLAFDYLEANIPGWQRERADWSSQLIASCARLIAEARDTASDVPLAVLRYLGKWLVQLPAIEASYAATTATITTVDNAGYTIDAGTRFLVKTAGDDGVVFTVVSPVTILPGSTSTAVGGVDLLAAEPGAEGSGLSAGSDVIPVDSLAYLDTITLEAVTTGGEDAETDDAYIARLIEELALFTPTPILPDDFAVLARRIPGVGRSLALNLYNPSDGLYTHARTVTVVLTDTAGEPVSGGVKTTVADYLQALREVNWTVPVIDATYTTIDVTYTAVAYPGYDIAAVETAADAAVAAYFSPANRGVPRYNEADPNTWLNDPTVRYLEVAEVLNRTDGLDYLTAVTVGKRQPVTAAAATDIATATAHGLSAASPIVFRDLTGGAPLVAGTTYYARDITTDTFKIAATAGGAAINLTTDLTAGTVTAAVAGDVTIPGPAALTRPGTIDGTVTAP